MGLDGLFADDQLLGDLVVAASPRDQANDFALAVGEITRQRRGLAAGLMRDPRYIELDL